MRKDKKYWNEKMETLPPEEYIKVQEKALLRELSYVWQNSLFYKEKFQQAGIELNDIKGLDDLEKLPFTEKEEIRESLSSAPPLGKHGAVKKLRGQLRFVYGLISSLFDKLLSKKRH